MRQGNTLCKHRYCLWCTIILKWVKLLIIPFQLPPSPFHMIIFKDENEPLLESEAGAGTGPRTGPGHVNPVPQPGHVSPGHATGHGTLFESEVETPAPEWLAWAEWSPCSTTGDALLGMKTRYRQCGGSKTQQCIGENTESIPCNKVTLSNLFCLYTLIYECFYIPLPYIKLKFSNNSTTSKNLTINVR